MLCGKEQEDAEVRGGVCRSCSEGVRREAAGGKVREKRASDRALRQSGEQPERPRERRPGEGSKG